VCQETGQHGFEAEMGEAIPSSTVTGRGTVVVHGSWLHSPVGGGSALAAEHERWADEEGSTT
jgi:hypothetical protein